MFCANEQMPLISTLDQLPNWKRELLETQWAKDFHDQIFPYINERNFAVLYSKKQASRPNSPVNVLVGLLIIKEIIQLTDEELIGSLVFDARFQYALHTMERATQPVSINTLTNFRNRLANYFETTGIDLIKIEVEAMAERIAGQLNIDQRLMRMDSLMISSSCKKLSRIELIYNVNHCMIKALAKLASEVIPESCRGYLEKKHKNEIIYRTRDQETDSKLEALLKQTEELYAVSSATGEKITSSKAFSLLARFIKEQTGSSEDGRLVAKPGKEIASESLQNPTDPDATYRQKHGDNIGYVGNVLNVYNGQNQVVIHYGLEQNTYSDQKFSADAIGFLAFKEPTDNTTDSKKKVLNTDGAYYTEELSQEAALHNIDLVPGQLTGAKPDPQKLGYDQFSIDEQTHQVQECPGKHAPDEAYFDSKGKCYTVKMSKEKCAVCPLKEQCPMKPQQKMNVIKFSEKRYHNDRLRVLMGTEAYRKLANGRAGVERIPSVLRRRYRVDEMPIRGLVRVKIWFGFKIAAFNFKSLVKGTRKMGKTRLAYFYSIVKGHLMAYFGNIIQYFTKINNFIFQIQPVFVR